MDETHRKMSEEVHEFFKARGEEIVLLRKLLWLTHGCKALYGDDGEMQCNCGYHPPIDFKRDTVEEIDRKIWQGR